jgi:hypothetical protein
MCASVFCVSAWVQFVGRLSILRCYGHRCAARGLHYSRLALQSERLGSELARHLGVPTPQARVIHSGSEEWAAIQAAVEKAKVSRVAAPHQTAC